MRHLFALLLLLSGPALHAQNAIWAYAIGNWRDTVDVVTTSLIQTSEAVSTPHLLERIKADYPAFKSIKDIDVLRFATREEAEENQRVLIAKYGRRGIVVNMQLSEAERIKESPALPRR